jgi:hypothetical protein
MGPGKGSQSSYPGASTKHYFHMCRIHSHIRYSLATVHAVEDEALPRSSRCRRGQENIQRCQVSRRLYLRYSSCRPWEGGKREHIVPPTRCGVVNNAHSLVLVGSSIRQSELSEGSYLGIVSGSQVGEDDKQWILSFRPMNALLHSAHSGGRWLDLQPVPPLSSKGAPFLQRGLGRYLHLGLQPQISAKMSIIHTIKQPAERSTLIAQRQDSHIRRRLNLHTCSYSQLSAWAP